MGEFLSTQFSWRNIAGQIMWALLLAGCLRAVTWLFSVPLRSRGGELAFWLVIPISILLLGTFTTFLKHVMGEGTREPRLKGSIDWIAVGRSPTNPLMTAITLIVSVRNLGAPSIVENWSASVMIPGGEALLATLQFIPETLNLGRDTGSPIVLRGADALYNKTVNTPLPTGGMQRGILLFVIDHVSHELIYKPGTRIVLHYADVSGRMYEIETKISGKQSEPEYYPGLVIPGR